MIGSECPCSTTEKKCEGSQRAPYSHEPVIKNAARLLVAQIRFLDGHFDAVCSSSETASGSDQPVRIHFLQLA